MNDGWLMVEQCKMVICVNGGLMNDDEWLPVVDYIMVVNSNNGWWWLTDGQCGASKVKNGWYLKI